jgi:hypothetical protein
MTQPHEANLTPRHAGRDVDFSKKYTGNYKPQSLASAAPSYKRIPPPRPENCVHRQAITATDLEDRGPRQYEVAAK